MARTQQQPETPDASVIRPRGRPRRDIDLDAVADAVGELFISGGYESVSIGSTAEKLGVSRATLYRTVPSKEHLLGILFERSTRELTDSARALVAKERRASELLTALVSLQVDAAVRMRRYMPVFFGGSGLPSDVFERWHAWSREYEAIWVTCVTKAMKAGALEKADPVIATRLLLGMCIWISRWYRPSDIYDAAAIADTAIRLIGQSPEAAAKRKKR